jgi:nickel-dependent lactate racemase
MLLKLKYGDGFEEAHFRLNGRIKELRPNRVASLQKPEALISAALDKPIVSYPIKRAFRRAKNLVVVVGNHHLPATTKLMLPLFIDALNQAFVPDEEISILIANGPDAPLPKNKIKTLVGENIIERIPVLQHNCRKTNAHEYVGETRQGTPLFVNKHLLDADEIILCGTISHHFITGYTGGPELIVPGCAGLETIARINLLALNKEKSAFNHRCADGAIDGNPVYEDIRDAFRSLSPKFGFYTIVNDQNAPVAAFAGNPLQAHAAGCRAIDRLNLLRINQKADLTIVSAGGSPNDLDFIRSYPALHRACYATREGGVVVLLAACCNGIGETASRHWFDERKNGTLPSKKASRSVLNRLLTASIQEMTTRRQIFLVSHLRPAIANKMGFRHFSCLQKALEAGMKMLSPKPVTYVIPNGMVAVPRYVRPLKNILAKNEHTREFPAINSPLFKKSALKFLR